MFIGAYYYLWYGRPTLPIIGGGIWRWGYANKPLLGEYNSRDEKVIGRHIAWAKKARIDFFVINWSDMGSWDDITLKDYFLKHEKISDIKFCLQYDTTLSLNRFKAFHSFDLEDKYSATLTKGAKLLEDFEYLAENYFNHPQYFKIDGKPVVIIYAASGLRHVPYYFDQLVKNMAKRGIRLYLVADAVCWAGIKISKRNLISLWRMPPEQMFKVVFRAFGRLFPQKYEEDISLGKYFKGITAYNLYDPNRLAGFPEKVDNLYQKFFNYANSNNLTFLPNIMPGYDDRKIMDEKSPVLERKNGEFYRQFGKIAKKYINDKNAALLITTFNEWHEGTEIEPSKEHGETYLELTKALKS